MDYMAKNSGGAADYWEHLVDMVISDLDLKLNFDLQDSAIATALKNEPTVAEKAKFAAAEEW